MDNSLECLIGGDLLPWERLYFEAVLRALGTRFDVRETTPANVRPGSRVWILARDWQPLIAALPPKFDGKVCVSVLGSRSNRPWFGLFAGGWNPRPAIPVRLFAHSPFALRVLTEMERAPEPSTVPLPLPGLLSTVDKTPSSIVRIGTLMPLNSDANLAFLAAVAHYLSQQKVAVKFLVPTTGKLSDHLFAMAADLGLGAYFEAAHDPSAHMDILLHAPWKAEHFIPVLWEAARATPVLSSDVPGIENLITDGQDGFVVPVNEVKPMGELIARLATNESLRHSLGDRLRLGLAKRFALDRWMERFEAAFQPIPQGVARAVAR